jgi:uncharacterized membrane protein
MNVSDRDLLATATVAALALIAAVMAVSPVPRTVLGLPLIFYLPGRTILRTAFQGKVRGLSAAVFASGLSLAVTIFCGFVLHLIGRMTPDGWMIALSSTTLVSCCVAHLAGRCSPFQPNPPPSFPALRAIHAILMGCAAATAASAVVVARQEAIWHPEFAYSELWLVPDPERTGTLTIGVKNAERESSTYELEVTVDGRAVLLQPSIQLRVGETWTSDISLATRAPHTIEARLFRDGNDQLVYRRVWVRTGV